jgi:hypothetical protein
VKTDPTKFFGLAVTAIGGNLMEFLVYGDMSINQGRENGKWSSLVLDSHEHRFVQSPNLSSPDCPNNFND